jgi:hypothetical protein
MARRLVIVTLVLGTAVGTYFAVWGWPASEYEPAKPKEIAVQPKPIPPPPPPSQAEQIRHALAGSVAMATGQGFPGGLPWQPLHFIGASGGVTLDNLIATRPLAFLQLCAERFDQEVQGYCCTFVKKERIAGKLYPPGKNDYEIIKVACREEPPFAVLFEWKLHPKLAAKALYVEGENKNMILAKPRGLLVVAGIQEIALDDPKAKDSGRYTMAQFGMGQAIHRTVARMQAAAKRGELHLRYVEQVKLKELDDRPCYKFVRTPYNPPEPDGLQKELINELTVYIDTKTWLQVGSILRDPDGKLVAEYYFRDIELNPKFDERQFTRGGL